MPSASARERCGCVKGGVHLHVAVAVKDHDYDHDHDYDYDYDYDYDEMSHRQMHATWISARKLVFVLS